MTFAVGVATYSKGQLISTRFHLLHLQKVGQVRQVTRGLKEGVLNKDFDRGCWDMSNANFAIILFPPNFPAFDFDVLRITSIMYTPCFHVEHGNALELVDLCCRSCSLYKNETSSNTCKQAGIMQALLQVLCV